MTGLYFRIRATLRALFQRGTVEAEMHDELRLHLERATERLRARGLSEQEARESARREFGNVAVIQEQGRAARGVRWIESVIADLRFALRHFARKPLASITIVTVLAIGIGVHSALFAMLQAVTTRSAPGVERRADLVRIRGKLRMYRGDRWDGRGLSYPEFVELAGHRELFSTVTAWTADNVTLDVGTADDTKSARAQFVTGPYFETLGIRPALGTLLPSSRNAENEGGEIVAVIGHTLWNELFRGAPDVVGRVVRINDVSVRIVGVAAQQFNGAVPTTGTRTVWMLLSARAALLHGSSQALISRDTALLSATARLAPDVSIERANAVVRVVAARAAAQMKPLEHGGIRDADVVPLAGDTELPETNDGLSFVLILGIGAALILLVACTNVSALVVGAGVARRQEITVRLSLGASRARIVRQLVTESCLLALCGGVLGFAIFWSITQVMISYYPELNLAPDIRTAAFTLVFALGTGILFGLSPALHATRRDLADVLKGSGSGATGRSRLQSIFVVLQIVVTQPLLVGLCLLFALAIGDGGKGMNDDLSNHLLRVRMGLDRPTVNIDEKVRMAMRELTSVSGVTGVVSEPVGVALVDLAVANDSSLEPLASSAPVSIHLESARPGYFGLLDVPIVRGRDLALADTSARDLAVVIGHDLARTLWLGADPIGKRMTQTSRGRLQERRLVVVGVFDATHPTTRGGSERVYAIDNLRRASTYLVRTTAPAAALTKPIRAQLRSAIPEIPVERTETIADAAAENRQAVNKVAEGAAAAALTALLLASLGLYGVVGLAVAQRKREIGIRMALGARAGEVVGLLFRVGLRLAMVGLVLGLPLSVIVLTYLARQIGISTEVGSIATSGPVIGLIVGATVLLVATVATWIPARKAATVEPMIALRTE